MLCHAAAAKGLTAAFKPLWEWLCPVGLTVNAAMQLDIHLSINGNRDFCDACKIIQQALLPADADNTPPHAQNPNNDAATITINELTKGL